MVKVVKVPRNNFKTFPRPGTVFRSKMDFGLYMLNHALLNIRSFSQGRAYRVWKLTCVLPEISMTMSRCRRTLVECRRAPIVYTLWSMIISHRSPRSADCARHTLVPEWTGTMAGGFVGVKGRMMYCWKLDLCCFSLRISLQYKEDSPHQGRR